MYSIITLFLLIMLDDKVIKIQLDQNQNKIWKQISLAVPSQPFIHIIGHFALPGGEGTRLFFKMTLTVGYIGTKCWMSWKYGSSYVWVYVTRGHHHTIGGGQWPASIWRWQGRCSQQWCSVKLRAVSTWLYLLLPHPPLPLLLLCFHLLLPLLSFLLLQPVLLLLLLLLLLSSASHFAFPPIIGIHSTYLDLMWIEGIRIS